MPKSTNVEEELERPLILLVAAGVPKAIHGWPLRSAIEGVSVVRGASEVHELACRWSR